MDPINTSARPLFASGMIGLAVVGFRFGDVASILQEIPGWVPARTAIPFACAAVMLAGGIGLLFARPAAFAARVLFWYLTSWLVLLNLPIVFRAPFVEVNWQGMGEIMVMVAGGWVLSATLAVRRSGAAPGFAVGGRGIRLAQLLFGFALLPLGLAHFMYLSMTAPLVPAWLPYHTAWAYVTGAAQMAAGLGILLSIVPRLAATLSALLYAAFTFLVWVPPLLAKPGSAGLWSEFATSWAITAAAWVVASSISARRSGTSPAGVMR